MAHRLAFRRIFRRSTTTGTQARQISIDLRSDTVTQPSQRMREAVLAAPTGDDVYGEDPTVKQLEQRVADLLGKEAAMFIPTGCMSNHCAIAAHCARGDELICGTKSHIFNYEGGHASVMMGVGMYPVETQPDGTLALTHVHAAIRVDDPHFPRSALLCLENSHNMCGGKALSPAYMTQAGQFAVKHGLKLHVDGARLANAAVAQNTSCASLVTMADTVSMCLSKGLGAPLGSVLAGSDATMYHTRRTRKLLGGGMRQAGFVAAAGLVALENIDRLAIDHEHARMFAEATAESHSLELVQPVDTNIVLLRVRNPGDVVADTAQYVAKLAHAGVVTALGYDPTLIRAVFHLDISRAMTEKACDVVRSI